MWRNVERELQEALETVRESVPRLSLVHDPEVQKTEKLCPELGKASRPHSRASGSSCGEGGPFIELHTSSSAF